VADPPGETALTEPLGVGASLRRSGPRLVRDAFGPLVVFYAGWKLIGLGAGIAAAVAFGVAVFIHERRRGRPAAVVRLALVLVAIRAIVGIVSGSGRTYLATEIAIDAVLTATVCGSLLSSRPFASWFATELYPLPPEVVESATYRRAMRTITSVWGGYFALRGLTRLAALLTLGTDQYALVIALTDAPFLLALLAWSVYYSLRVFRRSDEFGLLLATPAAAPTRGP
jgi:hypothetical protein